MTRRVGMDFVRSLMRKPRYSPHVPHVKQLAFIIAARSGRLREIFYGGAGGGGKSDALLMLALQDDWISNPDYSALILRKTFVDLNQPEGILNRAQSWLYGQQGVTWQAQHNRFVFDSGAVLQFGHCNGPRDHLKYRGGKYNIVCWDELTDFPEEQYTFLFSRQRRPEGSALPLLTASASNPGGTGHVWVRDRLVRARKPDRLFIPAGYTDNPHLDQTAYGETLENLLPIERARIKYGDWDALDTKTLFDAAWLKYHDALPNQPYSAVRAWDTAATPGAGDYTVGVKMYRIGDCYYIDDMIRGQWGPAEVEKVQLDTAAADGHAVAVVLEQEPGSAGKRMNQMLKNQLAGYRVISERLTGDKYVRAVPMARAASGGRLSISRSACMKQLTKELLEFTGDDDLDQHDDIVDACSLAFNFLARRSAISMG